MWCGRAEGESKGGMTSILIVPKRHSPFGGFSWFFFGRAKKNIHFAKCHLVNIAKPLCFSVHNILPMCLNIHYT